MCVYTHVHTCTCTHTCTHSAVHTGLNVTLKIQACTVKLALGACEWVALVILQALQLMWGSPGPCREHVSPP